MVVHADENFMKPITKNFSPYYKSMLYAFGWKNNTGSGPLMFIVKNDLKSKSSLCVLKTTYYDISSEMWIFN